MRDDGVIARHAPSDGREWDCQCARCGSSLTFVECDSCGGAGEDTDWEADDWQDDDASPPECWDCNGHGGFAACLSSEEWCEAHPMPGRERTPRDTVEWFTFDKAKGASDV